MSVITGYNSSDSQPRSPHDAQVDADGNLKVTFEQSADKTVSASAVLPAPSGAVVQACEDVESDWTFTNVNASGANEGTIKKVGSYSGKFTVQTAFTTGVIGLINNAGIGDQSARTHVQFWIKSDTAIAAGKLAFLLSESADLATPAETILLPALSPTGGPAGDGWYRVVLPFAAAGSTRNAVASIGFSVISDLSASANVILYIDDIRAISVDSTRFVNCEAEALSGSFDQVIPDGGILNDAKISPSFAGRFYLNVTADVDVVLTFNQSGSNSGGRQRVFADAMFSSPQSLLLDSVGLTTTEATVTGIEVSFIGA